MFAIIFKDVDLYAFMHEFFDGMIEFISCLCGDHFGSKVRMNGLKGVVCGGFNI